MIRPWNRARSRTPVSARAHSSRKDPSHARGGITDMRLFAGSPGYAAAASLWMPHVLQTAVSAVRTNAVEVKPVGRGRKAVLAGKRILQCLNVRIHDFNVFAAPLAEKMIVVRAAGMFVPGEAVAEMQFTRKAGIAQQLHGAVHCGLPEGRIFVPDEIVQFLNRQMAFLMKKN